MQLVFILNLLIVLPMSVISNGVYDKLNYSMADVNRDRRAGCGSINCYLTCTNLCGISTCPLPSGGCSCGCGCSPHACAVTSCVMGFYFTQCGGNTNNYRNSCQADGSRSIICGNGGANYNCSTGFYKSGSACLASFVETTDTQTCTGD